MLERGVAPWPAAAREGVVLPRDRDEKEGHRAVRESAQRCDMNGSPCQVYRITECPIAQRSGPPACSFPKPIHMSSSALPTSLAMHFSWSVLIDASLSRRGAGEREREGREREREGRANSPSVLTKMDDRLGAVAGPTGAESGRYTQTDRRFDLACRRLLHQRTSELHNRTCPVV